MLAEPVGQAVELALVGDVELDDRRRLRQPLRDPLHQPHPAEPGEHHLRALLLRDRAAWNASDASVITPVTSRRLPSSSPILCLSSVPSVTHAQAAVDRDDRTR